MINRRNAAFTLTEFFVLLISVIILFLLFAPAMSPAKAGSRVKCTSNLKQIALSYVLWANDNQQGFPVESPKSAGGIRDLALAGDLLSSIRIASNQMRTPSILLCPADIKRKPAQTFASLTTANISYFLNVDAAITNQNHILAGDRNLTIRGSRVKSGLLEITNLNDVQWANWLHEGNGNVALIDGSAHQVTTRGIHTLLTLGGPTNRLMIP